MTKQEILFQKYFNHFRPSFPSDERTTEVVNLLLPIAEETGAVYSAMQEHTDQETQSLLTQLEASAKIIRESGKIIIDQEKRIKELEFSNKYLSGTLNDILAEEEVDRKGERIKKLEEALKKIDSEFYGIFYMDNQRLMRIKSIAQEALKE